MESMALRSALIAMNFYRFYDPMFARCIFYFYVRTILLIAVLYVKS